MLFALCNVCAPTKSQKRRLVPQRIVSYPFPNRPRGWCAGFCLLVPPSMFQKPAATAHLIRDHIRIPGISPARRRHVILREGYQGPYLCGSESCTPEPWCLCPISSVNNRTGSVITPNARRARSSAPPDGLAHRLHCVGPRSGSRCGAPATRGKAPSTASCHRRIAQRSFRSAGRDRRMACMIRSVIYERSGLRFDGPTRLTRLEPPAALQPPAIPSSCG